MFQQKREIIGMMESAIFFCKTLVESFMTMNMNFLRVDWNRVRFFPMNASRVTSNSKSIFFLNKKNAKLASFLTSSYVHPLEKKHLRKPTLTNKYGCSGSSSGD